MLIISFTRMPCRRSHTDCILPHFLPVVICTTGHTEEEAELIRQAARDIPVLKSQNMSLGINLLILLLMASDMSESVFFPAIAVGGLMLTVLFSTFFYKEKLSRREWLGILVGAVAIALLNL